MDILEENLEMQQEEQLAMRAIYGDSILQLDQHNSSDRQSVYLLTLNVDQDGCTDNDICTSTTSHSSIRSPRVMVLRLFFPTTYPSNDMPVFEVTSIYCGNTRISSLMLGTIQQGLHALFQPGQVVLFDWVQWLGDYIRCHVKQVAGHAYTETADVAMQEDRISNNEEENDDGDGTMNLPTSTSTAKTTEFTPRIFSSQALVDRKSIFVAHVASVKSVDQVKKVISTLLENKRIARATHNMMAYRINLLPGNHILQDNDDDGETAAGGRLMHLLQILDVKDVVVVVTRWFGGILLGPDRFKDINNCARQALEDCGYLQEAQKKKAKK